MQSVMVAAATGQPTARAKRGGRVLFRTWLLWMPVELQSSAVQ